MDGAGISLLKALGENSLKLNIVYSLNIIQYLLHISELLFHFLSRAELILGSCDVFSGGWDDMKAARGVNQIKNSRSF